MAYAQRSSGVLVPKETLRKQQYTLPERDFVKMRRLMQFAREFGLVAMYFCETCQEPVQLTHGDRLIVEFKDEHGKSQPAKGGRISLACGCSAWTVR